MTIAKQHFGKRPTKADIVEYQKARRREGFDLPYWSVLEAKVARMEDLLERDSWKSQE